MPGSVNKLAQSEVEVVGTVPALADQLPVVWLVVAGLARPQVQPGGGGEGGEAGQDRDGSGEHDCEVCQTGAVEPHSCSSLR